MYVLHRDSQNPSLFVFVEHWRSEQALKQHMQTPHFKALAQALDGKLTQPIRVHVPAAGLKGRSKNCRLR